MRYEDYARQPGFGPAADHRPDDRWGIVPRAIPPGGAVVRPFEFQVRTLLEYDINFMQDRIRSDVFVNGKPVGIYAVAHVQDDPMSLSTAEGRLDAIRRYGPDLERMVADEFMGLGYRRQVRDLQRQVSALRDEVALLRRPWYRRLLDKIRPPKDTDTDD